MGRILDWMENLAGKDSTDWYFRKIADTSGLSGTPIKKDDSYIEVYLESLRISRSRRFATTFHGVVYAFFSFPRWANESSEIASVSQPQQIAKLDEDSLDRVITVSKRVAPPIAWRGGPLGLELGLFSVKSGNVLSPLVDYVEKISKVAGLGVASYTPLLPLVTDGLDLLAGQQDDVQLELAIHSDMNPEQSEVYALIALSKKAIDSSKLALDAQDKKLLLDGEPLDATYCVFSIRHSEKNSEWGEIPALASAFADFNSALLSGRHKVAQEALGAFRRQLIVNPDLLDRDKDRLIKKAEKNYVDAFPGGAQAGASDVSPFSGRKFKDMDLYEEKPAQRTN